MDQQYQSELLNWIPYRLVQQENEAFFRWLYVGDQEFTEPFFDSTIAQCQQASQNSKMLRSLSNTDVIRRWQEQTRPVEPGALIFHVSRCGSTLVSQLLAASNENIVLSEVPFFDELLMGRRGVDHYQPDTALFAAAVKFYTHQRHAAQQRFFIKADSWHMFYYKEYRELFPDVPLVLLYREPAAVIRSHKKQAGMHAVHGLSPARLFNISHDVSDREVYMGEVLNQYYRIFLNIARSDKNAVLVNYGEGVMQMMEKISTAAGMMPTAEQRAAWSERSQYHAKYPGESFKGDGELAVNPEKFSTAIKAYEELESWRLANK